MRRLSVIGPAGLNLIVRTQRNFQRLLGVSVEVANQHAETTVGILEPPFERACNALSGFESGLEG